MAWYSTGDGQKVMMRMNDGSAARSLFVEMAFHPPHGVEPITKDELRRNIERRPEVWGQFRPYLKGGALKDRA